MSDSLHYLSGLSILADTVEERVREFTASAVPPEIQALGSAEAVHHPHPVWAMLANSRYLLAGVLLAAGGVALGMCSMQFWRATRICCRCWVLDCSPCCAWAGRSP